MRPQESIAGFICIVIIITLIDLDYHLNREKRLHLFIYSHKLKL